MSQLMTPQFVPAPGRKRNHHEQLDTLVLRLSGQNSKGVSKTVLGNSLSLSLSSEQKKSINQNNKENVKERREK